MYECILNSILLKERKRSNHIEKKKVFDEVKGHIKIETLTEVATIEVSASNHDGLTRDWILPPPPHLKKLEE